MPMLLDLERVVGKVLWITSLHWFEVLMEYGGLIVDYFIFKMVCFGLDEVAMFISMHTCVVT